MPKGKSAVQTPSSRDGAIDAFRGLTILLMFIANYFEHIRTIPASLKHATDIGITIVDFIAPFFIFAIGLTFAASVAKRASRDGTFKAAEHVIKRAFALIGIGMMFSIGEHAFGFANSIVVWGVLQAIGVAIILSFPFLFLPTFVRLALALLLLGAYQWALDTYWITTVLHSSHAGLPGSLSWALLLVIATVFGDLLRKERTFWMTGAALLAVGIAAAFVFPVSKHRMSLPFVLITVSSGAIVFGAVRMLYRRSFDVPILRIMGMNPLVLYCAHLMLLSVFLVPSVPWWHTDPPALLAAVQGVAFIAALMGMAFVMYRKKRFVSL